ncbi:RNA polymerase sigma factor [Paracidobacterium acidisoli]|nr:RNA polymerase sigma factor [Paracidobacterium acidisoli]MBT9332343.1 RNA polymerase sigma factor [Paracidobacterium acidisoli]
MWRHSYILFIVDLFSFYFGAAFGPVQSAKKQPEQIPQPGNIINDGPGEPLNELPIQIWLSSVVAETERTDTSSPPEEEVIAMFDAYRNRLFRYVVSFGLTTQDSEDVIQEVFLLLFRHLQMDRSRHNLRGWIFRVGHNLALKRRINNRRPENMTSNDELTLIAYPDPDPDPEQRVAFRQRQNHLLAIVHAMPEQDERCLRLRAEGLKYREIAEVLGISLGSVSIALTRAMARLRRADMG